jgi:hypothetical protein
MDSKMVEVASDARAQRNRSAIAMRVPMWQRYEQACDVLEDDLDSGYVRLLREMIAAGWSIPAIGAAVRDMDRDADAGR